MGPAGSICDNWKKSIAADCKRNFRDVASGGYRERHELARAIASSGAGDTPVVARLDRLARSLSHLIELIEGLRAKGAHFRSFADPFDTASPQGMLMMQMPGAFAEFERALIRGRTKSGIAAAVARGAKPGNPKIRARDPVAIALMKASLADAPRGLNLRNVLEACSDDLPGLRVSELVAIQIDDIVPAIDADARLLRIQRSKGDPEGHGATAYLSARSVRAIGAWTDAAGIGPGVLFRRVGVRRSRARSAQPGRRMEALSSREHWDLSKLQPKARQGRAGRV